MKFTLPSSPVMAGLDEAIPVLSLHRWIGLPEMVYLPGIRRYLRRTWNPGYNPPDRLRAGLRAQNAPGKGKL